MHLKTLILISAFFISQYLSGQMVKDPDGNLYSAIKIGKQLWFSENLKTTRYNDGKPIPLITDMNIWKTLRTPAYCWFNNDISNKDIYGALYNFYTVSTGKLCSKGWHVPSQAEWNTMISVLGPEETAGDRLKEKGEEHWQGSFGTATDDYNFTAIPGGMRIENGDFPVFGHSYAVWWTSTGSNNLAWNRGLFFNTSMIYKGYESMRSGFSVRCIKD